MVPSPQRRPQYGSDVIADTLHACGIVYAARNPGASFRGLHDFIVKYGGNRLPALIETPEARRPTLEDALRVVKEEGRLALVDIVMQPR